MQPADKYNLSFHVAKCDFTRIKMRFSEISVAAAKIFFQNKNLSRIGKTALFYSKINAFCSGDFPISENYCTDFQRVTTFFSKSDRQFKNKYYLCIIKIKQKCNTKKIK